MQSTGLDFFWEMETRPVDLFHFLIFYVNSRKEVSNFSEVLPHNSGLDLLIIINNNYCCFVRSWKFFQKKTFYAEKH